MRGILAKYTKLGSLLREGRERKGMTLESAAMIVGMTNGQYLWRCEQAISNFPARFLSRALDLYDIPVAQAVDAIVDDFQTATIEFLREK